MRSDWQEWSVLAVLEDCHPDWNHASNWTYWSYDKCSTVVRLQLKPMRIVRHAVATIAVASFSRRFSAANNFPIWWDHRCLRCQRIPLRNSIALSSQCSVPLPSIDRPLRALCRRRPILDYALGSQVYREHCRLAMNCVNLTPNRPSCHLSDRRKIDRDNWKINSFSLTTNMICLAVWALVNHSNLRPIPFYSTSAVWSRHRIDVVAFYLQVHRLLRWVWLEWNECERRCSDRKTAVSRWYFADCHAAIHAEVSSTAFGMSIQKKKKMEYVMNHEALLYLFETYLGLIFVHWSGNSFDFQFRAQRIDDWHLQK